MDYSPKTWSLSVYFKVLNTVCNGELIGYTHFWDDRSLPIWLIEIVKHGPMCVTASSKAQGRLNKLKCFPEI